MEVLVVLGILVLIASILIPVVSRARGQASRTQCADRMHHLGEAVVAFGAEHNGDLPTAGSDVPVAPDIYPKSTDWILWGGSANPTGIDSTNQTDYMNESGLAKYLGVATSDKSNQANERLRSYYRCPSVTDDQRTNDAYKYDYVFNAQLSGLPIDRVQQAGKKAMIVEAGHQLGSKANDSAYRYWSSASPQPNTVAMRHGGNGANCLYADGHVDIIDPNNSSGDASFTLWDAYYTPATSASNGPQQTQKQNNPSAGGHYNAAQ